MHVCTHNYVRMCVHIILHYIHTLLCIRDTEYFRTYIILLLLYTFICTYVRTLLFSHDPSPVLLSSLYAHSLAVGMYVHVVNGMIRR